MSGSISRGEFNTPVSETVSALNRYLNNENSLNETKVKHARTAFYRKVFGAEKLTEIDKKILVTNIGASLLGTLAVIFTGMYLKRTKLRMFPAITWVMAGVPIYFVAKIAYEVPIRMAFADYVAEQEK